MRRCKVSDLQPGMLVDLEGDKYADPDKTNPSFVCEYEKVVEVVKESKKCIYVEFESGFACGFPPDHTLELNIKL